MKKYLIAAFSIILLAGVSLTILASDISITAGSFIPSSAAEYYARGTCGAASVTAGQVVYYDTATGTWLKARATAAGTTPNGTSPSGGLACHAASPGQALTVLKKDPACAMGYAGTKGQLMAVSSSNSGGITVTVGDLTTGHFPFWFGIILDTTSTARIDFENAPRTGSAL